MRARRLGVAAATVGLAAATNVRDVVASLDEATPPDVVDVDSIQAMYVDVLDSAPGPVPQVRPSAADRIRLAKRRGLALLLVRHVTKEGTTTAPRAARQSVV